MSLPPQLLLMRTSRTDYPGMLAYANPAEPIKTTPFSAIEVRMVPENLSNVPRSPQRRRTGRSRSASSSFATVRRSSMRCERRSERAKIVAVFAAFGPKPGQSAAPEGRRLKLLFADLDGSGEALTLARVFVYADETLESNVAINDHGDYVRVMAPRITKQPAPTGDEADDEGGMRLYDLLYETALKQKIPRPIIDDLVRIFANDVDFERPVTGGDFFTAFYDNGRRRRGA